MDVIAKALGWLFGILVPPGDADDAHVRNYRWAVSSLIMGGYIVGAFIVLLALGEIPALSSGVVWKTDVLPTEQKVNWLYEQGLSTRIDALQERRCNAAGEYRQQLTTDLTESLRLYREAKGTEYPLQPC